jgi:hypothetical protein
VPNLPNFALQFALCCNNQKSACRVLLAQELDISWNKIKPEGVDDLCQGLEVNMGLVKLSLAWNGLEDTGVVSPCRESGVYLRQRLFDLSLVISLMMPPGACCTLGCIALVVPKPCAHRGPRQNLSHCMANISTA